MMGKDRREKMEWQDEEEWNVQEDGRDEYTCISIRREGREG